VLVLDLPASMPDLIAPVLDLPASVPDLPAPALHPALEPPADFDKVRFRHPSSMRRWVCVQIGTQKRC
jgi:hypothetical protein